MVVLYMVYYENEHLTRMVKILKIVYENYSVKVTNDFKNVKIKCIDSCNNIF